MILDFDPPDGPLTDSDYEAVHDARHPGCVMECGAEVCLCPLGCLDTEPTEVEPGRYVCGALCLATHRKDGAP